MLLKVFILAIIGALIGWMTNVIAIKLMFRPINPVRIPLTPFFVQGLMPKRKSEIAKSIGEVIDSELVSMESIIEKLIEQTDKKDIIQMLKNQIIEVASNKMPSMIPSIFKGVILQNIESIIDENGESLINSMVENLSHKAIASVQISKMVEDQINAFDFEKIEAIVLRIARTELKHIEILGGVIGFLIGVIQGVIVILL